MHICVYAHAHVCGLHGRLTQNGQFLRTVGTGSCEPLDTDVGNPTQVHCSTPLTTGASLQPLCL